MSYAIECQRHERAAVTTARLSCLFLRLAVVSTLSSPVMSNDYPSKCSGPIRLTHLFNFLTFGQSGA